MGSNHRLASSVGCNRFCCGMAFLSPTADLFCGPLQPYSDRGAARNADQSLREHEISEINPPAWLKWGLTIASHLLLAAIAFAVAWLFFPQQRIFFVDPFNHTAIEAPPGTRISPDGNLSVPKPKSFEGPTPDKNAKPTTPQSEPQAAPKSDGGKDQNVPRQ